MQLEIELMEQKINKRIKRGKNINKLRDKEFGINDNVNSKIAMRKMKSNNMIDNNIVENNAANNVHQYAGMTMEEAESIKGVGNVGRYKPAWQ